MLGQTKHKKKRPYVLTPKGGDALKTFIPHRRGGLQIKVPRPYQSVALKNIGPGDATLLFTNKAGSPTLSVPLQQGEAAFINVGHHGNPVVQAKKELKIYYGSFGYTTSRE